MKRPVEITDARKVCRELGARGVIIIAVDRDRYASASYGATNQECGLMRVTLRSIARKIESGEIPIWEEGR